jgi:subtilisin family serine protease
MSSDFKLRHFQHTCAHPEERVHVLVQFRNDVSAIADLGFQITSVFGDIAAGSIHVGNLDKLKGHPNVSFIEASRTLKDETDVSAVAINLVDPANDLRLVPGGGRGAIIGIIDSGFDLTHPCFSSAQQKTRIIAAWDQANIHKDEGASPAGFGYGIEYTQDFINAQLAARKILVVKNQEGAGAHGTYVAGIAAGNGTPHGIYKGIAPEADLILVTYRNDVPVGGSAFVLDAIHYIQEHARVSGRPVVINISQGDNLGAHDGMSLLERAIDNLVGLGRVQVVTSVGNERGGPVSHHAHGELEQGHDLVLPFTLMQDNSHPVNDDTIELWYRRGDRFAVALRTPDGWTSDFVPAGTSAIIKFPAGNQAHIYSEANHPTNGDNHIGIILEKGAGWSVGTWSLILRGEEIRCGDFDAWADRPNAVTVIGFERYQSDASTVTLPGNGRRVITVGGFISRPERERKTNEIKGGIAPGSSIGPTRDGRVKPDLTAPSTLIMAPRIRTDNYPECYDPLSGTSMAAPHVTGIIALLWALWPGLTAGQIRAALYSTARKDTFTGATPNTSWGSGKLDAEEAYKALLISAKKGEVFMENKIAFEFEMKPQPKPSGELAGMSVRIEVDSGETIVISGTSNGEPYQGTLILRKKKDKDRNDLDKSMKELSGPVVPPGGDECYIDGRWYSPCPIKPGGGG